MTERLVAVVSRIVKYSILFKRAGNKSLSKVLDLIESIADKFMVLRPCQEHGQVLLSHLQGVS